MTCLRATDFMSGFFWGDFLGLDVLAAENEQAYVRYNCLLPRKIVTHILMNETKITITPQNFFWQQWQCRRNCHPTRPNHTTCTGTSRCIYTQQMVINRGSGRETLMEKWQLHWQACHILQLWNYHVQNIHPKISIFWQIFRITWSQQLLTRKNE
jgi:hypothetical protein